MFYNDYRKSFMVIEARGMFTKNIMKNISYRNGRGQAFIVGFYYMALIYFSFKTYQMECYVRIPFYGSISFKNKSATSE